jgi:cell division protein FtsZ
MSNNSADVNKELEAVLGAHKTRIKIIGTGGGGNNTVTRLIEVGIKGVEVIAVNTDAQDLLYAQADQKVLIGKDITNGLGAGSDPARGEESAKESMEDIENMLKDTDMVFITCGLGGGTGTGSAPILAEVARKRGALTIAIVTLPFSDEGIVRWQNARKGLDALEENVDTVIVVQNDKLLDLVPDMPLNAAFKVADEILVNAVKGITELVTEKGLVNLDFADVRTIMQNGGLAMIGLGESESENNAEESAERALQNPLLDIDVTGAKSALINITGGHDMSLKAAKTIMKIIAERLDQSAKIIWGARIDESMERTLRVMLIVTSLQGARHTASEIEMTIRKANISAKAGQQASTAESPGANGDAAEHFDEKIEPIPEKSGTSKVFSDIFIEESDADIAILGESIKGLTTGSGKVNEKYLREIKNGCASIYSSAELFSYSKISEIVDVVGDLAECALNGDFELSESFIELFQQIPDALRALTQEEQNGNEVAEELMQKFKNILELLEGTTDEGAGSEQIQSLTTNETDNSQDEEIDKNGDISEANSDPADEEEQGFADVRDAVKYFDKDS